LRSLDGHLRHRAFEFQIHALDLDSPFEDRPDS
jgi:hypothetical protein